MTTKTCTKCNEAKSLDQFSKHKNNKDGLQYNCNACKKSYRLANKDHIIAYTNNYYEGYRESLTLAEKSAKHSVVGARNRSDLSSFDLYGGQTFNDAWAMTIPFAKERLRLEADTGVAHHIDHIIPIAAGGTHTKENLQVLTAKENVTKGAS